MALPLSLTDRMCIFLVVIVIVFVVFVVVIVVVVVVVVIFSSPLCQFTLDPGTMVQPVYEPHEVCSPSKLCFLLLRVRNF